MLDRLRGLGLRSPLPEDRSVTLGATALNLSELAYALAVLPAGGRRVEPLSVLRITDAEARAIEDHGRPPPAPPRLSPETAYIVTDMMKAVIESGTARRAQALGRPAAGSMGSSSDHRYGWFVGFTPELLCGVRVGRDGVEPAGRDAAGAQAALSIWLEFMRSALDDLPVQDFPIPSDVVFARANPDTGAPAAASEFKSRRMPFKRGTVPAGFSARTAPAGRLGDDGSDERF